MNTGLEKLVIPFVGVSRTPETYTYGNNGLNATLGWYFNCDHNWYYTRSDLWGGTYVSFPINNEKIPLNDHYNPDQRVYVPSKLKTVIVTDTTTIAKDAFRNMSMIETIILPFGLDSEADNELGMPDIYATGEVRFGQRAVTTIGDNAFDGTNLKEMYLPASLEEIGEYAFRNNKNLTKFVSNSAAINKYMFYGCSKLSTVITDYITEIPDYAFYECLSLIHI